MVEQRESGRMGPTAGRPTLAHVWQRWEQELTSARQYANPYADVTVSVVYSGPGGATLRAYGFWDGGDSFRIRCAFPRPGVWRWQTECSDAANAGLHRREGSVTVQLYTGTNPLYRRGFLRVSENRRYLVFDDGTPFLWMGDSAWAIPWKATEEEWETYLETRLAQRFTLLLAGAANDWAGRVDAAGNPPFLGEGLSRWNPAYWQAYEQKLQRANERGFVFLFAGVMEPVSRYPSTAEATLFARNIAARFFGNFVLFSPSLDSEYMPLADEVGRALREATAVHLITQHPGTPSGQPSAVWSEQYYDQAYLDICGVQTGHNEGRRDLCARQALDWPMGFYRHEPHKPVINLEAMYDGQGKDGWTADDARSLGYRSWLSGALGYIYGAGESPPKVPQGSGGVFFWVSDTDKYDHWRKALHWESARQMTIMHDFFAGSEWWRLEPAPELIRGQPEDPIARAALAKSAAGDLAVAYLPRGGGIRVDLSILRRTAHRPMVRSRRGRMVAGREGLPGRRRTILRGAGGRRLAACAADRRPVALT